MKEIVAVKKNYNKKNMEISFTKNRVEEHRIIKNSFLFSPFKIHLLGKIYYYRTLISYCNMTCVVNITW